MRLRLSLFCNHEQSRECRSCDFGLSSLSVSKLAAYEQEKHCESQSHMGFKVLPSLDSSLMRLTWLSLAPCQNDHTDCVVVLVVLALRRDADGYHLRRGPHVVACLLLEHSRARQWCAKPTPCPLTGTFSIFHREERTSTFKHR